MRKIRDWIVNTFLPAYAKQTILAENAKLKAENAQLRARLREQEAYIDGFEDGIRAQRRVVINNNQGVSN